MKNKPFGKIRPQRPHQGQHTRDLPSRNPLTPAQPDRGLSSLLNRTFVSKILKASLPQDVNAVLAEAGYRTSGGAGSTASLKPPDHDAAVERAAVEFLKSAAGLQRIKLRVEAMLDDVARQELASEEGRRRLLDFRAKALAGELANDGDGFARMCQREIVRQIERWMASPAGQETLAFEKQRVVEREARRQAGLDQTVTSVGRWTKRPSPLEARD